MTQTTPSATPANAWRQFAHSWDDRTTRAQYATHCLRLPPLEAYSFAAQPNIPASTQIEIKRWRASLAGSSLPASEEFKAICGRIADITDRAGESGLARAIVGARQIIADSDFNLVRQATWTLATGDQPLAGLLIGTAMQITGHPVDGGCLITEALFLLESHPSGKAHESLVADWLGSFSRPQP